MIANFFQSLEQHKVEYLLISGQATVLYGAATFSEDVDLWINPSGPNCDAFLSTLQSCGARYYKLTPEFTLDHLLRGHGFHFVLPVAGGEFFLDVMGAPPRVGSFVAVAANAKWMETEWGNLHTIGIHDLVELKKTQRLEDYAIISKLVLAWFRQPDWAGDQRDFRWAMENLFTLTELRTLLQEQTGAANALLATAPTALKELVKQQLTHGDVDETLEHEVSNWMHQRMTVLQQADRHYWRRIISDLRTMRTGRKLMPEGTEVHAK